MTHPIVYAGSAVFSSGVIAFGLVVQASVSDRSKEIAAIGDIVESVALIAAPILIAWIAYKVQQATALAKANLDKTEEVDKKVDERWLKVDERLDAADRQNSTYAEFITQLTAEKAAAVQAAAIAGVEKAGVIEASRVKELAEARAQAQPMPVAPVPAVPAAPTPVAEEHLEEIAVNTKDTVSTLQGTAAALKDTAAVLKDKA